MTLRPALWLLLAAVSAFADAETAAEAQSAPNVRRSAVFSRDETLVGEVVLNDSPRSVLGQLLVSQDTASDTFTFETAVQNDFALTFDLLPPPGDDLRVRSLLATGDATQATEQEAAVRQWLLGWTSLAVDDQSVVVTSNGESARLWRTPLPVTQWRLPAEADLPTAYRNLTLTAQFLSRRSMAAPLGVGVYGVVGSDGRRFKLRVGLVNPTNGGAVGTDLSVSNHTVDGSDAALASPLGQFLQQLQSLAWDAAADVLVAATPSNTVELRRVWQPEDAVRDLWLSCHETGELLLLGEGEEEEARCSSPSVLAYVAEQVNSIARLWNEDQQPQQLFTRSSTDSTAVNLAVLNQTTLDAALNLFRSGASTFSTILQQLAPGELLNNVATVTTSTAVALNGNASVVTNADSVVSTGNSAVVNDLLSLFNNAVELVGAFTTTTTTAAPLAGALESIRSALGLRRLVAVDDSVPAWQRFELERPFILEEKVTDSGQDVALMWIYAKGAARLLLAAGGKIMISCELHLEENGTVSTTVTHGEINDTDSNSDWFNLHGIVCGADEVERENSRLLFYADHGNSYAAFRISNASAVLLEDASVTEYEMTEYSVTEYSVQGEIRAIEEIAAGPVVVSLRASDDGRTLTFEYGVVNRYSCSITLGPDGGVIIGARSGPQLLTPEQEKADEEKKADDFRTTLTSVLCYATEVDFHSDAAPDAVRVMTLRNTSGTESQELKLVHVPGKLPAELISSDASDALLA